MSAFEALQDSAAFWDVSSRGRLRVSGEDRDSWMQAIAANDVESVAEGQGVYTFFLNAQGRIQSDTYLYRSGDSYLLDCEADAREALAAYLEQFIIMEDVAVDDVTDVTGALVCEGPLAKRVVREAFGVDIPADLHTHGGDESLRWFATSRSGQPGALLVFPAERLSECQDRLEQAGAAGIDAGPAEVARVEAHIPQFGTDFTEKNIPHETGLFHAFSMNKGCYPGQEIVERVRTQGQVNRLLCAVNLDSGILPETGAPITLEDKPVGALTSPVIAAGSGLVVGFAMLRRAALAESADLRCGGVAAHAAPLATGDA